MNKTILPGGIALFISLTAQAGAPLKAASPKPATSNPAPKLEPLTFADGILTVDLEGRVRFEARSNNRDFNSLVNDDNDDAWAITRFRLGLGVKVASWLRLYAQLQDTREIDSERPNTPGIRGTEGDDNFDLRQAYAEFSDFTKFPLGLAVGRQRLSYGDQRLVADSRWGNFGRTFDAIKLRWQQDKENWLDLFAARPVQIKQDVFNDSDSADNFFGAYYSTDRVPVQTTDLYVLYRDKADTQPDLDPTNLIEPRGTWNGPAQRVTTVGTRWKSKPLHGWDYTLETAYQWGDVWQGDRTTRGLTHRAFAAHLSGGYTWEQAAWTPRLGIAYNYASGDRNPADGKNEGFLNLFPSNHGRFGDMDLFGWRNLHNLQLRLAAKPARSVEVEVAYHADWLADTSDYWYRGNGISAVRTSTPATLTAPAGLNVRTIGAGNFAGQEVDLAVKWTVNPHVALDAGYAHFFAGDYLHDTGPADDADFGYVQATVIF